MYIDKFVKQLVNEVKVKIIAYKSMTLQQIRQYLKENHELSQTTVDKVITNLVLDGLIRFDNLSLTFYSVI